MPRIPSVALPLAVAALLFCTLRAGAVTFVSTSDPGYNTSAPAGNLSGSGWQYEASFGPFLATAIGRHYFLTARHVGLPANVVIYQGVGYSIQRYYDDPGSDLRILDVAGTLPSYAPLYGTADELGHDVVVIGRGMQRGSSVYVGSSVKGWNWGNPDSVQRWGENQISRVSGSLLYATFDQNGMPNEAGLSSGDSGGAVFINDGQVWRLAGINYGVDGPFALLPGSATFYATLFDTRGLFDSTTGQVASGAAAVPSGFYATRIFSQIHWLRSIIAPALGGISAQGFTGTGNDALSVTFTVEGGTGLTKHLVIRALGPSLQTNGVPVTGRLLNPTVELRDGTNAVIATNDDWNGTTAKKKKKKKPKSATTANPLQITSLAPSDAQESAVMVALAPGQYTAIIRGTNHTTGIGLVDVHDIDPAMDGAVVRGVMATGSIKSGSSDLTVTLTVDTSSGSLLLREIGPELASSGVASPLGDPQIELRNSASTTLATNDNWRLASNSGQIQNTGLAPLDDRDSALMISPTAGTYTVVVRGANGTTGTTRFLANLLP